jgi:hypothetical protein
MPSPREMVECESLGQLADRMQEGPPSGPKYHTALAELERRKACWEQEATEAAKEAADAAKEAACAAKESARAANDTAEYTKKNARYMLWSVIAIFVTSLISALVNILAWLFPRGHA